MNIFKNLMDRFLRNRRSAFFTKATAETGDRMRLICSHNTRRDGARDQLAQQYVSFTFED